MRYAQIIDNRVINPCDGASLETALHDSFAPGFVMDEMAAGRSWVQVPDYVPPNAILDGQGGWTLAPISSDASPTSIPTDPVAELSARVDRMATILDAIAAHLNVEVP